MSRRFLFDTNAISILMHGRSSRLEQRLVGGDQDLLSVSVITFGEIRFGLALRPGASRLAAAAENLFARFEILPWTREVAEGYGTLRAEMQRKGKTLEPLDMLIAAHAMTVGATLVTVDRAFRHVPRLETEDWTA